MGPLRFELRSEAPEAPMLDQATPRARKSIWSAPDLNSLGEPAGRLIQIYKFPMQ